MLIQFFFPLFLVYLVVINIVSFIVMYLDKQKAKKGQYRISEQNLWNLAWYGGAFGCTLGMKLFRHKTKKGNFSIGFPMIAGLYFIATMIIFALF